MIGLLAVGCLANSYCDDPGEPTPQCPPTTIGVLQGRVLVAGRPVSVGVGARLVDAPGDLVAQTRSDAQGRYRVALPPAAYRIELNPRSGASYTSSDVRDTVHVGPGVRFLDIRRGSLIVRVAAPLVPNGLWFYCSLEPFVPQVRSERSVVQNGKLEFEFPNVWPGTYRLRVQANGSSFWLPGTSDPQAADAVMVGTTNTTTYAATLHNCSVISGTVRGSWQEAGASAPQVAAYTLEGLETSRTWCANDGSFALAVFDVQPVRLLVSISRIDRWIGGTTFETARKFFLRPDQQLRGVAVVEGGILLQLEGPGYLPDYRARVALLDQSGRTYTGDTAYGNPIPVCNLPSGSYRLYVHGDCDGEPWASQWYDGADSLAAASFIDVVAGHATRVTMRLDHDGRIEGRVLDNAGLPAPVRLALYRDGAPVCEHLYAVGWNPFSIRGLGNGDYTLAAVLDGAPWWYPGTAFADSAQILRIRNHGTLTGIEWRLPARDTGVRP